MNSVTGSSSPLSVSVPYAVARSRHSAMQAVAHVINLWRVRARSRAQLRTLDDRMLRDIGMSPDAADSEVRKPFWVA
ncbi:DUF1127 domain-containing protein [Roseospira marina]|nr:DUF1127 domain-containing protein [Roseospira marina]MBB4314803.1 uncharacterized protein YjiS (DUF1127 family) [Roseospira marina]MBB5087792.1 uncharacterized protein YjiS (DUF1127 family) [Roseospira marina]